MKGKQVAWLLTAAMLASSVGNSAVIAQGAEVSPGSEEVVQNVSEETEETGAESEDQEETETSDGESENQGETETSDGEGEEQGETKASDAENEEESDASGDMDSSLAETATTLDYKKFTNIPECSEDSKVVYKFTAPKDGDYQIFSDNAYGNIQVYDASFLECEMKQGEVFNCKAGEVYYLVGNFWYVEDNGMIAVYPTIASFEMIEMPQMDYVLWDDEVSLSANGAKVRCVYSNGESEVFTDGEGMRFSMTAKTEDDGNTYWPKQPGTYEASMIITYDQDDIYCDMYSLENIGTVTVKSLADLVKEGKDQAKTLQVGEDPVQTDGSRIIYAFTPKEDGHYNFSCQAEDSNSDEDGQWMALLDDSGNAVESGKYDALSADLKTGTTYYLILKENGSGNDIFTSVSKGRTVKSIAPATSELIKTIGWDDLDEYDVKNDCFLNVTYDDGTSDTIRYGETSADDFKSNVHSKCASGECSFLNIRRDESNNHRPV